MYEFVLGHFFSELSYINNMYYQIQSKIYIENFIYKQF